MNEEKSTKGKGNVAVCVEIVEIFTGCCRNSRSMIPFKSRQPVVTIVTVQRDTKKKKILFLYAVVYSPTLER